MSSSNDRAIVWASALAGHNATATASRVNLVNRYANTVVLTFAEIEDLLGFTLPDPARLHSEWWTSPDPNSDRPRTVVFERSS